ncbi:hypothetical protein PRK78_002057 [Emydomyces testavorans]|uniref:Uncharacterized protein n=1 Tax=Emydomyces testavorans TaxID=2070801 RepID=A0AAF0IJA0_9EURO|nr:hypothetical protein PRK78_002057 [Emydomyces testavorans]
MENYYMPGFAPPPSPAPAPATAELPPKEQKGKAKKKKEGKRRENKEKEEEEEDKETEPKKNKAPRKNSRESAEDESNITLILPTQRDWSIHNLPDILYQLKPTQKNKKTKSPVPMKESPYPDEPKLRHFDILPDRISTNVEDWRVETWKRLDARIRLRDITDRMLPDKRLQRNALQQRLVRFRQQFSFLTWGKPNQGSIRHEAKVVAMLAERGIDLALNTTRGLSPGLIDPNDPSKGRIPIPSDYKIPSTQMNVFLSSPEPESSFEHNAAPPESISNVGVNNTYPAMETNARVNLNDSFGFNFLCPTFDANAYQASLESGIQDESGQGMFQNNNETGSEYKADSPSDNDDASNGNEKVNRRPSARKAPVNKGKKRARDEDDYEDSDTNAKQDEHDVEAWRPAAVNRSRKKQKVSSLVTEQQQDANKPVSCPSCHMNLPLRDVYFHLSTCKGSEHPQNFGEIGQSYSQSARKTIKKRGTEKQEVKDQEAAKREAAKQEAEKQEAAKQDAIRQSIENQNNTESQSSQPLGVPSQTNQNQGQNQRKRKREPERCEACKKCKCQNPSEGQQTEDSGPTEEESWKKIEETYNSLDVMPLLVPTEEAQDPYTQEQIDVLMPVAGAFERLFGNTIQINWSEWLEPRATTDGPHSEFVDREDEEMLRDILGAFEFNYLMNLFST